MKIYTKYGDQGNTQLLGGQSTTKDDLRIMACGGLDEFSAALGIVGSCIDQRSSNRSDNESKDLAKRIQTIQANLLTIGANIAALKTDGSESKMTLPSLNETQVEDIEEHIDELQNQLPELTNFILPGGALDAAHAHFARTVCRRAERNVVALLPHFGGLETSNLETTLKYLNRLSDWCFVLARYLNHAAGVEEPVWKS